MVNMIDGNRLTLILVSVLITAGCTHGNDLEQMRVYGDVVKIETVSLTNIPIMEYYQKYDPRNGIANTDGNYILTFNRRGDVTRYQGFGCDLDELFDVSPNRGKKAQGVMLLSSIPLDEIFDSVAYELNEYGDVALIEWYEGEKLSRKTSITYDLQQRPYICVSNSGYLSTIGKTEWFLTYDTSIIKYTETDSQGNWTTLEIEKRSSFMPERNNTRYCVLRQITYRGEPEKIPLIRQDRVKEYSKRQNILKTHELHPVRLGSIATISIPDYMTSSNTDELKDYMKEIDGDPSVLNGDLCRYECKGQGFATFAVSYFPDAATGWNDLTDVEKVYDKDFDDMLRMQYETPEAQKMISLLKWYPYSFVTINGNCAVLTRYIRYGKGSSIPVYVESYLLDTPDDGALLITMSYQINRRQFFHQDLVNAVHSLRFN